MKYRITTRGWVVFSTIGLLLVVGIINLGQFILNDPVPATENLPQTSTEQKNLEANEDQSAEAGDSETLEPSSADGHATEEVTSTKEESTDASEDSSEMNDVAEAAVIPWDKSTTVLFNKNVAELKDEFVTSLNEWVELLKANEQLIVIIEGHINGYPYYEDGPNGLGIAENRAQVIADYFLMNGVDESQIEISVIGSKNQVVKTDDVKQHYLNRRAVIFLKKK